MTIHTPRLAVTLTPVEVFTEYTQPRIAEDETIAEITAENQQCEHEDFFKLDLRRSVLKRCVFHKACFEKASFVDVEFHGCDFANANLRSAYFERCRFIGCKGIGIELDGAMIKHTVFDECNLQYANLNTAKLNCVQFKSVDFTDASMAEVKLSGFETSDTKFIRNDFSKTMLKGVDFTGNVLAGPIVSYPPVELQGMVVDMFQAASLAGILGVKIKQPT